MKTNKFSTLLLVALFVIVTSAVAGPQHVPHGSDPPHPDDPHKNLAEAATNPMANLIQFQVQDTIGINHYEVTGASNTFVVQPVIPIKLPFKKVPTLITRTTVPYAWTQKDGKGDHHQGFGNIASLGFFNPKLPDPKQILGVGWALAIPLQSTDYTGSKKWSAGPSAVYINLKKKGWQWGMLSWYLSSFAGSDKRSHQRNHHVSQIYIQPILTKHFAKGWYMSLPDDPGTYNFATSNWSVPLGAALGRVFKLGKLPVKAFGESYYSPWEDGSSKRWTIKMGISFLFPE